MRNPANQISRFLLFPTFTPMYKLVYATLTIFLFSCKSKVEKIKPTVQPITESVYASGVIRSLDQYQAYATVNGLIENIYVQEGDTVSPGTPILTIKNDAQRLTRENAELTARYADRDVNSDKLNDAKAAIDLAKAKYQNDSLLYARQQELWRQNIGTKIEVESRELAYLNSKNAYSSAKIKYTDVERQLELNSQQSKKQALISGQLESDFIIKSKIRGMIFSLLREKGELVGPQTPLAVLGDSSEFILEMQVDEYDILKIRHGQKVIVSLDSYKSNVFEARVNKIHPIMNERTKTFLVEAVFVTRPPRLYPNITFEANIVIETKSRALLIPRNYLVRDSFVVKENGDTVQISAGLKDYKMVEILKGLAADDEIVKPK